MGEGEYNLNILKEIEVTNSFLGLHENVKGCQNVEHIDECKTKLYIETVMEDCGCIPLNLKISNKVYDRSN